LGNEGWGGFTGTFSFSRDLLEYGGANQDSIRGAAKGAGTDSCIAGRGENGIGLGVVLDGMDLETWSERSTERKP
jgi:hypothetical protein